MAFPRLRPKDFFRAKYSVDLRSALVVCLLVGSPLQSFAHDLYLVPSSFHVKRNQTIQVSFRNGDAFPESEVAPKPERLQTAQVTSAGGRKEIGNLRISGNETLGDVTIPAGSTVQASVTTVPNFIELEAAKFTSYLKEEGLSEVVDWRAQHGEAAKPGRERYTKFAKSLLQADGKDDYYRHPLGLAIEIIPQANPYDVHVGGTLPVQVLFHGKPAANLQLEAARTADGKSVITPVGRTDAQGRVNVPVDHTGKWRLHSLLMQRASDPTVADWESFWASLTFEIS